MVCAIETSLLHTRIPAKLPNTCIIAGHPKSNRFPSLPRNDARAYMYSYISSSRDCSGTPWRKCPLSLLDDEILDIVLVLLDLRFWFTVPPSSSMVGISSTRIPRPADEFRAGGILLYWYCWSGRETSNTDGRRAVAELLPPLFILGEAVTMVV